MVDNHHFGLNAILELIVIVIYSQFNDGLITLSEVNT